MEGRLAKLIEGLQSAWDMLLLVNYNWIIIIALLLLKILLEKMLRHYCVSCTLLLNDTINVITTIQIITRLCYCTPRVTLLCIAEKH